MPSSSGKVLLLVSASLLAAVNAMHQNREPTHSSNTSHTDTHTAQLTRLRWRTWRLVKCQCGPLRGARVGLVPGPHPRHIVPYTGGSHHRLCAIAGLC